MPISFSAWCIISLVTRSGGVGDGLGEGTGVGEGVCASVWSGSFVAARPAAPMAGSSFTNVRRVVLFFFIVVYLCIGTIVPVPTPCVLGFPYFSFTTFALPKR